MSISTFGQATESITNSSSQSIIDNTNFDKTFVLSNSGSIEKVTITLRLDHSYRGDLEITLTSPSGTTINLTFDNGGTRNNLYATFDDAATNTIGNDNTNHISSSIVLRKPDQALSAFIGENAAGTWTLNIADDAGVDEGTFNSATINVTTVDTDNDGIADLIDLDDDNDGILDAEENIECTGSLNYEFYNAAPSGNTVDNIPTTGATGVGTVSNFNVTALQTIVTPSDANTYSIRYTGFIKIPTTDTYTFYLNSDDGAKVYIDGNEAVSYDGLHAASGPKVGTPILLNAGGHTIEVLFFEYYGQHSLNVEYASTSSPTSVPIPFSNLSPGNCDSDGDSIPNSLDLDSDNDGIPDNIEGQTTRDYKEPSGNDADNDGLDDAYDANLSGSANSFGITPVNTDATATTGADTVPDYLDLDSDGDTIFDIAESGSGLTNTAGRTNGIVGTNGLDNTLDTADDYTDINGSFDNTQTDNFTDVDTDVLTFGDVDYRDITED
ncbi:proprotein convertase P-domain-containing protein [Polaribacter staleyi]|uniref:proprotein convertase P-domain-containing protein n=1 Tax=Polaribacter staleyi TaxID=2022337 RepID=UPI0031BA3A7B